HNTGRIGQAHRGPARKPRQHRPQCLQLLAAERMVRLVGAGEMAQAPRDRDTLQEPRLFSDKLDLACGESEAGHSGVEMQRRATSPLDGGELPPGGEVAEVVECRYEAMAGVVGFSPGDRT